MINLTQILFEYSYDYETLVISRIVVNQLKSFLKTKNSKYSINIPLKNQKNTIQVNTIFNSIRGLQKPFYIGGAAGVGNELDIVFDVDPAKLKLKHLNSLIPELKNIIRHELEHYDQYVDKQRMDIDNLGYDPSDPWFEKSDIHLSTELALVYYLEPAEVEANCVGWYKKAKNLKMPIQSVFAKEINNIKKELAANPDNDKKEIKKVITKIATIYKNYLVNRYGV